VRVVGVVGVGVEGVAHKETHGQVGSEGGD
jgi:hypothetical protein